MALAYPVERAARSTGTALSRGAFWFGTVFLVTIIVALFLITADRGTDLGWPAAASLVLVLVAGVIVRLPLGRHPFVIGAAAAIAVVGVASSTLMLLSRVDSNAPADTIVFTFVKIAVIMFGLVAGRYVNPIVAIIVAYVIAELPVTALSLATGHPYSFDVATSCAFVVALAAIVLLDRSRARARVTSARLQQAATEDREAIDRDLDAMSSSALVHDTVLNELAVVATIAPGELTERAREQIRRSVELVSGTAVTEETPDFVPLTDATATERAPSLLDPAIADAASSGLTVVANGESGALSALAPDVVAALVLAVRQCLANVMQHAGVTSCELTVLSTASDVCVMVIDSGAGFDEETVDPDRFGLRNSVRARIVAVGGSVQIWSAPGAGTSIAILVPRA